MVLMPFPTGRHEILAQRKVLPMTGQVLFPGEPLRYHILSKQVDKLGEILLIL
jgi:hypothetical protein